MSDIDVSKLPEGHSLPSFHDVIRWLVAGGRPNTELNNRLALLAVDAHERGYPTTGHYLAELQKQGEVAAAVEPVAEAETADEKASRLEAENARLQAQIQARVP